MRAALLLPLAFACAPATPDVEDAGTDAPLDGGPLVDAGVADDAGTADESVEQTLARWAAENAALGDVGAPGSFDFGGADFELAGDGRATAVDAPFTLEVAALDDAPFAFFPGAVVQGVGAGVLVLQGASLSATAGALADVRVTRASSISSVLLLALADDAHAIDATLPDAWADAEADLAAARATGARPVALALGGFTRGVLVTATGPVDVVAPIVVDADDVLWSSASRLAPGAAVDVPFDDFAFAVTAGGDLALDGVDPIIDGAGAVARSGVVRLTADRVASVDKAPVTQAIATVGVVLPADVEVLPTATSVTVPAGGEARVAFHWREKSGVGDAILQDVLVDDTSAFEVPVARPHRAVADTWAAASGNGWATPLVGVNVALFSPPATMVDVDAPCPDAGCPFPLWVKAGALGTASFVVRGALAPGSHPTTVRFVFRNAPEVVVPIRVLVE